MEYRNLGSSGLKVSSLCLGAMTFGEPTEGSMMHGVAATEETSHAMMNRALEAGVTFWDTADVYGNDGLSERVIGRWFEQSGRRHEVQLATKFRFTMSEAPNGKGGSRHRIVRACEESLRRLKTDYLDLYQIHMQDNDTPEEETLRALDDLVRQGKVLYVGCSNYAAYRLADADWISRTRGWERFVSLQAQYNLIVRDLEREHVPLCRSKGIGILPWSPLASGFLTGKHTRESVAEGSRLAKWKPIYARLDTERGWAILDAVRAVAAETESTPAAVSLAWLLAQDTVSSVIFGARTMEQLDANLAAADLVLSEAQLATLTEASGFDPGYPYSFIQMIVGRW